MILFLVIPFIVYGILVPGIWLWKWRHGGSFLQTSLWVFFRLVTSQHLKGCLWRWWCEKGSLQVKVGVYWLFDRWGCSISIYLWVYWVTMTGIQLILASFWAINKVMGVKSMEYRWEEVDYGYCKTGFKSGYNICGILQMVTLLHVWT